MSMSNSATNTKDAFNLAVLLRRKNEEVDGEGHFSQRSGFSPVGSYWLEAWLTSYWKPGLDSHPQAPRTRLSLLRPPRANTARSTAPLPDVALPSPLQVPPHYLSFICEGRFPADIIVMMAHLIKLFNCSGNHYHHHRCSIIHHFWRALLTSRAHSPTLLKSGQISPTPLGVSAGCYLSSVELPESLQWSREDKRGTLKRKEKPISLFSLSLIFSFSLISSFSCLTHTLLYSFILLVLSSPPPQPPPPSLGKSVKAQRRGYATFYSPEWVQSWRRRQLLRNSLFSILWDHEPRRERGVGERGRAPSAGPGCWAAWSQGTAGDVERSAWGDRSSAPSSGRPVIDTQPPGYPRRGGEAGSSSSQGFGETPARTTFYANRVG